MVNGYECKPNKRKARSTKSDPSPVAQPQEGLIPPPSPDFVQPRKDKEGTRIRSQKSNSSNFSSQPIASNGYDYNASGCPTDLAGDGRVQIAIDPHLTAGVETTFYGDFNPNGLALSNPNLTDEGE
jgi:hypothetical protein